MRKGFFHVVEALIVIMLVFLVLSQFYSIPRPTHYWSETKLRLMAQDLLDTMEEKGVDWFDFVEVNRTISEALPPTMGFALETTQSVRPETKVLCVCPATKAAYLESIFTTMPNFNGVTRTFTFTSTTLEGMDFTIGGPHLSNDVILFWGYPGITSGSPEAQSLNEYLSMGNGIIEYANLSEAQAGETWHQETFNLRWADSLSVRPDYGYADFNLIRPDEKSYGPIKLYNYFNGDDNFLSFGYEKVYPADERENKIVLRLGMMYSGGSDAGRSIPLATVNWGVGGKGRTAWMSNGTLPGTDNMNADLLKSLVIWAAAEKPYVVKGDVMAENSKSSLRKVLNQDMYEPMRIDLMLGYHF